MYVWESLRHICQKRSTMTLWRNIWIYVFQAFLLASADAIFKPQDYPHIGAEQRLSRDLLKDYETSVRPIEDVKKPVIIALSVMIVDILELDEKLDLLDLTIWDMKMWKDVRLQWNPANYSGITQIRPNHHQIWIPDIVPYNNVEISKATFHSLALVTSDGTVVWVPTVRLKLFCDADLTKFPYDKQTCKVKFGSWTYDDSRVNLTYYGSPENALTVEPNLNEDWIVVDKKAVFQNRKYECCEELYADMTVTLELQRSPSFYSRIFIAPAILLGLLVPVQLLLPAISKERLTLGCVLLMTLLFMNFMLLNTLPNAKSRIPTIQIYYLLTLAWNTAALITSVVVFNAEYRGVRRSRLPNILRMIFLGCLKKLVCVGDTQPCDVKGSYTPAGQPFASEDGHLDDLGSRTNSMTASETEHMAMYVQLKSKMAAANNILSEWNQVAVVLDRILFVILFALYIFCSIILVK